VAGEAADSEEWELSDEPIDLECWSTAARGWEDKLIVVTLLALVTRPFQEFLILPCQFSGISSDLPQSHFAAGSFKRCLAIYMLLRVAYKKNLIPKVVVQ
jgi:Na+-transporting methylmalonyl-CoA/oxaloacetate decarboxylase beta subunit